MIIFNNIKIKVIGVGHWSDCAIRAVERIEDFTAVETIAISYFKSALDGCKKTTTKVDISRGVTLGLDGGPENGEEAALANKEEIKEVIKDSNIVIIVADMGGNNGVGASPIIADLVKKNKAICISIAIKPFHFYGKKWIRYSELGINNLKKFSDVLIEIANDRCIELYGDDNLTMDEAFNLSTNKGVVPIVNNICNLILDNCNENITLENLKTVFNHSNMQNLRNGKEKKIIINSESLVNSF